MRKTFSVAICIFALCSLLLASINVTRAAEPGYTRTDYNPTTTPTVDGKWTTNDEWELNGEVTTIGTGAAFRSVWILESMTPEIIVTDTFLVEFFIDTTNDAGDYWQLCIDGDQSGGSAPQSGDYRIDIIGHTTLKLYQGTGTGWTEITPDPADIIWNNTLSASPSNSTAHWILELKIYKAELGAGPTWNFRLAMYDASTGMLLAWPPTPRDEPARWGVQNYVSGAIPETFSIAVVVLLLSTAAIVSFYFLRKRPKIKSSASTKTSGSTQSYV